MATKHKQEMLKLLGTLTGVLLLGAFLSPTYRKGIAALDSLYLVPTSLAAAVLCGCYGQKAKKERLQSPEEKVEVLKKHHQARSKAADHIINKLRSADWSEFEKFTGALYTKIGYSVTPKGGANPDGGIDLIAELETERIAVQCKHWRTWKIDVKEIREFLGALTAGKFNKGHFVTLAGYTAPAKQFAEENGIDIINERELNRLIQTADADDDLLAILNNPIKQCPKCGRNMETYTPKKGVWTGTTSWRCSDYPNCQQTIHAAA